MKLEGTIYCDGKGCEAHQRLGLTRFDGRGRLDNLAPGWLRVSSWSERGQEEDLIFCSTDCMMKWCAAFPPTERIPWFGDTTEGKDAG